LVTSISLGFWLTISLSEDNRSGIVLTSPQIALPPLAASRANHTMPDHDVGGRE
jgi:hypothetical protein